MWVLNVIMNGKIVFFMFYVLKIVIIVERNYIIYIWWCSIYVVRVLNYY